MEKSRMTGRAWAVVIGYFAILTIVSGMAFFVLDLGKTPEKTVIELPKLSATNESEIV